MSTTLEDTTEKRPYNVIGTRPIRHDGTDKVTGRAKYGADVQFADLLHGAVLRSPHAHAAVKSIDTSAAAALPGVHAVITNRDFPEPGSKLTDLGEGMFDLRDLNRNVLAREKVLYKGHAIAAVAAANVHVAQQAIKLIKVEYDVLPHVLDIREAMKADAPLLHATQTTLGFAGAADEAAGKPTNVSKHFLHEKGDVEQGFQDAQVVIEREFTTSTVHQGYIEPHNATVLWKADGHITCWTSTQGTFPVRQQLAGLLHQPLSNIKVVPMEIGGGFGGKIVCYLQPLAAMLSKKTGRPVKLVMDRTEVLEATGPTPASYMKLKLGVNAEGMITAGDAYIAFEAGAFKGSPIPAACMTVFACYDVPNGRVNGYDVCVNRPVTRAYRAPGATQAAFALETIVDEICEELKIDKLEFRLKNASRKGTRRVDGPVFARIGMLESVQAIKDSEHWKSALEREASNSEDGSRTVRGRGVASGFWFNAGLKSAVSASVSEDGQVALVEGSTDIGGSRASIAMQLAETLGIGAHDVHPTVADTDSVGYTDVTGGSRVTYATGWAAYEAGLDIQRQMCERAALIWDVEAADVKYADGNIIGPGDDQRFTFKQLAAKAAVTGHPIIGRGSSDHNEPGGAFATHVVDVEVDPDTGKVDILRYTASQDAGTAIHPSYVEGQMQGGCVQGIGWALNEEYFYGDDGRMRNSSFLDYRMPTCYDVPMIDTIIVEVPNPGHPYGVRGAGEVPIVPPPAAIANAIYDAVGVRYRHLPMSPPHVLQGILSK
ncbi:MAG: xanthine dehydrogenase family protein molybdopterin-binding subunit [Planctomycetota bacterium]|nr:xanthine dehydrogenase family protein molybdopterin-binding subunit [Planctomycetota bacterium]